MKQRREEVATCNRLKAKPEGEFGLGYNNMEGEIIPQLQTLHPDFMTSTLQEVFELYDDDATLGTLCQHDEGEFVVQNVGSRVVGV
jgi:hypothetical protein